MAMEAILRTADSVDFDEFDYKHYDQERLPLEAAIKKATEARSKDNTNLYRVVPADAAMTGFYVDSVPVQKAQRDRFSEWVQRIARNIVIDYLRKNG